VWLKDKLEKDKVGGVITVIYIVGSGRSGSTVLDTVLGAHDSVESVGELAHAVRAWRSTDEYCACGQLAGECDFWGRIRTQWRPAKTDTDLDAWVGLQRSIERFRNLPLTLSRIWSRSAQFRRYAEGVRELFEAIAAESGRNIIVDSSKSPVRGMALAHIAELNVIFVHLVRDGRGVAWSLRRSFKKDAKSGVQRDIESRAIARTALFWVLVNRMSDRITGRRGGSASVRIRYEDFVQDPGTELSRVAELVGVNYDDIATALSQGEAVPVGHTIAGNRLRMSGGVKLKANWDWQEKMPQRDKRLFWMIAGSTARRYGYRPGQ
jgi:hypothetical protein